MKKQATLIFAIVIALLQAMPVYGDVGLIPSVTEDMLEPLYWTQTVNDADQILADADTISSINAASLSDPDCNMNDLENEEEVFDGVALNRARWKSAMSDLSTFLDGKHYEETGNIISGNFAMDVLENLDDPDAAEDMQIRYGICVHRSDVRVYPTKLIIADDPGDYDFDNVQNSGIKVGEPVTVYAMSRDGAYYYCHTSCVSGWIPSEDIAICRDKEEWEKAWKFDDDDIMVVTSSKMILEESNTSPELSGLMLTMGTVLQKVKPYEYGTFITNRSPYYNHTVWIPVRNAEGMYERRRALISVHHDVSDGYLPLTSNNILTQAYKMLGDAYGWGAMLSSADCSSYVRDVYKCFGMDLPRNTTWQSAMPALKYDLSLADDDTKKELFDRLPAGTVLFFKGHEMIYLGHEQGQYYVISATSSMMYPGGKDRTRIRGVIINSLDEKRANGNTWLSDLNEALVPYIKNEENLKIPVFAKETKTVSDMDAAEDVVPTEEEDPKGYKEISFDPSWDYAENAKITEGIARLYRSESENRKDITVCLNAGHGTEGGTEVKVLCHPDGSGKLVTGSTAAGQTEAVAVSAGTVMTDGLPEGDVTLKAALVIKEELLADGYDVLMIREEGDVQLDNIARTLIANNNADVHIAIHYDSTDTGKGVFYCGVPSDETYREMEPVSSHWQQHEKLGKSLIYASEKEGFSPWNDGNYPIDLVQTSYSTIPSVDLELGDTTTDHSYATLVSAAKAVSEGLDWFFK